MQRESKQAKFDTLIKETDDKTRQGVGFLSKWKWRIIILVIVLSIVLIIISLIWDKITKNRRFNRVQKTMGRNGNPMLLRPDQNLITYYKKSVDSSPMYRNSVRFQYDDNVETIGFDISKLRPGDIILTRYLLASEKQDEVKLLKRLFPNRADSFGKWTSRGGFFRGIKKKCNVESIIQTYVGKDIPTHVCLVGRIKPLQENEKLSSKHVEIWDMTIDTARSKLSLAEFFKKHPCTMARYWVLNLNSSPPDPVIDLVDHYFENVYQPKMRTSLAFDYIKRGKGTCLANRKLFYNALNTSKATLVSSRISAKSINNPKLPALEPYVGLAGVAPEPRVLVSPKNATASSVLIEDEVDKDSALDRCWNNWKGLEHGCYSCSAMVYAQLEAFGLVLNMSDRFSFVKQAVEGSDGTLQLSRGNVAEVSFDDCLTRASEIMTEQGVQKKDLKTLAREWQSDCFLNPTSRIRIMAPQLVTPDGYFRSDFQWADGVYVRYASRAYFVQ